MKRLWTWTLAGLLCLTPALGQEQEQNTQSGDSARPKPAGRQRVEHPGRDPQALIEQIARALELTDSQRAELERIAAETRPSGKLNVHSGESSKLQELRQTLRKGDKERADQIRRSLNERRGGSHADRILDALEPLLTEAQKAKVPELRKALAPGLPPGASMSERLARLKMLIGLDARQSEEFDALLAEFEESYRQLEAGSQTRTSELVEQLREAVKNNDTKRVAEVREQIGASRAEADVAVMAFLAEVEGLLREDQKEAFERYTRGFVSREFQTADGDARRLLMAARRLGLTDPQREQLKNLEREAQRLAREARRDPEGASRLYQTVREQLAQIIGADQVAELERKISRHGSARTRHGGRSQAQPASEPPAPEKPAEDAP